MKDGGGWLLLLLQLLGVSASPSHLYTSPLSALRPSPVSRVQGEDMRGKRLLVFTGHVL